MMYLSECTRCLVQYVPAQVSLVARMKCVLNMYIVFHGFSSAVAMVSIFGHLSALKQQFCYSTGEFECFCNAGGGIRLCPLHVIYDVWIIL